MTNDNRQMIRIQIDRLVLHGFTPTNRARLDLAISTELARLIEVDGGGAAAHASPTPVVRSAPIHAAPDAAPDVLGVQIARAIYGGLTP